MQMHNHNTIMWQMFWKIQMSLFYSLFLLLKFKTSHYIEKKNLNGLFFKLCQLIVFLWLKAIWFKLTFKFKRQLYNWNILK